MTFNEGDEVYVHDAGRYSIRKEVVSRVTKTQAIISHERYEEKFNRKTGREIGGDSWNATRIDHPTPGLDKQYRAKLINRATRVLSDAALKGTEDEIRAAFAHWDQLTKEGTS